MENHKDWFDFIRYSLADSSAVPVSTENMEWREFFAFCYLQGIAGLVFSGIERSGATLHKDLLYEWIGVAESIKSLNRIVNERTVRVSDFFGRQGDCSCILKGQVNATMYPKPELRGPGDIDIWVEGETEEIIRLVQQTAPQGHYSLHHVTMPVFADTSVEVHYRPIFLDNWWLDRRFRKILDEESDRQFAHRIPLGEGKQEVGSLTDDLNALYQILHLWHHLLSTRNNLKQLVDYYFLLKRGLTDGQKQWVARQFHRLGVEKYARDILWIEREVLGLETRYLILQPDEKIGRLLLRYVLSYGDAHKRSKVCLLFHRFTDNIPLLWHFPSAVLINPLYLVWHQWWKWQMKRKLKTHVRAFFKDGRIFKVISE